jgi:hypothetical protein
MCVLRLISETDSFKSYREKTVLPVCSCFDKGEKCVKKIIDSFIINFNVSDKEWDDFKGQVEDAKFFLKRYKSEIHKLMESYNITDAFLDFPIYSRLAHNGTDDDIINQNDHLPRELISLAGELNIGIEMAIYSKEGFDNIICNTPNSLANTGNLKK